MENVCGIHQTNKAFSMDSYPLPSVDMLVDGAFSNEALIIDERSFRIQPDLNEMIECNNPKE